MRGDGAGAICTLKVPAVVPGSEIQLLQRLLPRHGCGGVHENTEQARVEMERFHEATLCEARSAQAAAPGEEGRQQRSGLAH